MQLIYSGPHPEVVVDEFDTGQVIVAGQPVEIPDELAARLIEQNTWALADKPRQTTPPTAPVSQTATTAVVTDTANDDTTKGKD